jgi:hypothetical protein
MLQTSLKLGGTVKFFSIYFDTTSKMHIAWFYDNFENIQLQEKGMINEGKHTGKRV